MFIAIGILMMLSSVIVHQFDIKDQHSWSTPLIRVLAYGGSVITSISLIYYWLA